MRDLDHLPRVLTPAVARRLGVSRSAVRHRVASGRWQALAPGFVLTGPDRVHREDWAAVGLAAAGDTAALSGWDAVRLRGVGARTPPSPQVLVLSRSGTHRTIGRVRIRSTRRAFASWRLPADHPRLAYERVAGHARAVADTALQTPSFADVRALVTGSVQLRLCSPDELLVELADGPRNGSQWLRRSVDDVLDGARSAVEAVAVDRLRVARVPAFEVNVPVLSADGVLVAALDVFWRSLRAVIEVDSRAHHFQLPAWDATMSRHNALGRVGLAIEHHPPARIAQGGWAEGVRRWLRGRACELGVAYTPGHGPIRPGTRGPEPLRLVINSSQWSR